MQQRISAAKVLCIHSGWNNSGVCAGHFTHGLTQPPSPSCVNINDVLMSGLHNSCSLPSFLCKFSHVQPELQPNWIIHLYFSSKTSASVLLISPRSFPRPRSSSSACVWNLPVHRSTDTRAQEFPDVVGYSDNINNNNNRRQSNTLQENKTEIIFTLPIRRSAKEKQFLQSWHSIEG